MFHPASYLLVGICLLLLVQRLPAYALPFVAALVIGAAFWLAKCPLLLMLRRTRWLFLALITMFSLMTPGVLVPPPWGLGGITQEGLLAAAEHGLRLATILALLALLLCWLEQREIISGLYALLRPFSVIGIDRERISVRLLLVLDHLAADRHDWRTLLHAPSSVSVTRLALPASTIRPRDIFALSVAVLATILCWLVL